MALTTRLAEAWPTAISRLFHMAGNSSLVGRRAWTIVTARRAAPWGVGAAQVGVSLAAGAAAVYGDVADEQPNDTAAAAIGPRASGTTGRVAWLSNCADFRESIIRTLWTPPDF